MKINIRTQFLAGVLKIRNIAISILLCTTPSLVLAQKAFIAGVATDSLVVSVNNIAINGKYTVGGLTANFPFPVLSTISVTDSNGTPIIGLADTTRWLGPKDIAEIGRPIEEIWQPVLEYHRDEPTLPTDPNVYQQPQGPFFTEVRQSIRLPISAMLVMDVSTSMAEELDDAKAAAHVFVDLLGPMDRAGVIQFATQVTSLQRMTSDKNTLHAAVQQGIAEGYTALFDALMLAIQETKNENSRRGIIAYTDGMDNRSKTIPEAVIDSAKIHGIPIFTIALGNDASIDTLKQIASETGGLFFQAVTAAEMRVIFAHLSTLLKNFYVMAHASTDTARNNTWRTVDLTVQLPERRGSGNGEYFVPGPPKVVQTDLTMRQFAETDTSIVVAGDSVQAVVRGGTYSYTIQVQNLGPATARDLTLKDILPDSVSAANFSLLPKAVAGDTLFWSFDSLAVDSSITITATATVSNVLPFTPFPLVNTTSIAAKNDSTPDNDRAQTTVYAVERRPVIEQPRKTDLVMRQFAETDTSIVFDGHSVPAVIRGGSYIYSIQIKNLGPAIAHEIAIHERLPAQITAGDFSLTPSAADGDSLVWFLGSLAAQTEFTITFAATVDSILPSVPLPLVNIAQLTAANDSTPDNNFSSTTVYAINRRGAPSATGKTDLAVQQTVTADSVIFLAGDSVRAVFSAHTQTYAVNVSNLGSHSARDVTLWNAFPPGLEIGQITPQPFTMIADTAFWLLDSLAAGDTWKISFEATVPAVLPSQPWPLRNTSTVSAINDTVADNNSATITVYAIERQVPPPKPSNTDLAIDFRSVTDSATVVAGRRFNAVFPGDTYTYRIRLENHGAHAATTIKVQQVLPPSVEFIEANLQPASLRNDSLSWEISRIDSGGGLAIEVAAWLAQDPPVDLRELISTVTVSAENDTTPANNAAADTVRILSLPPKPAAKFDLAIDQRVDSDTSIVVGPDTVDVVYLGSQFTYQVTVANNGPVTARDFTVTDYFPGQTSVHTFSLPPARVADDSLFWRFDSLAAGGKIMIDFKAIAPVSLPSLPVALVNTARVFAADDSLATNNVSISTVYATERSGGTDGSTTDVAISQTVATDSFAVTDLDTVRFVRPGEIYTYTLRVANKTLVAAQNVVVSDTYPARVVLEAIDPPATRTSDRTIQWNLWELPPLASQNLRLRATVAAMMPPGINELENQAEITASNEPSSLRGDNISITTVYSIVRPNIIPLPAIEANPPVVNVGDSVSVRVQTRIGLKRWDLWVYFADGHIDSTFADDFVATHRLTPDIWTDLDRPFTNTHLFTAAHEEQIIFEIRTLDDFDNFTTARALVSVRSANAMVLDRNVFSADTEGPLAINFKLSSNRVARLDVYDIAGAHISTLTEGPYNGGWNTFYWNGLTAGGQRVGSGVYVVTLRSGEYNAWKKVIVVR